HGGEQMRRLTTRTAALTAAGCLVLAGCTGGTEDGTTAPTTDRAGATTSATPPADDGAGATTTAPGATAAPAVELEVPYPAPADTARVLPEDGERLTSDEGHELTLVGVHRLADDRVVVTALLSLDPAVGSDFVIDGFEEPALRRSGP